MGRFCTDCEAGLVQSSNFTCAECLSRFVLVILCVLALSFMLAVLYVVVQSILQDSREGVRLHTLLFKVVVGAFQVNSIALLFAFDWYTMMTGLLQVQQQMSSLGTAYFNLGCLMGLQNSFVAQTVMFALGPLVLGLTFWLLLRCKGLYEQRKLDAAESLPGKTTELGKTTTVIILFLLQPTLTQATMSIFRCVRLGDGPDQWYLAENLHLQCWAQEHMLLVFLLGIPMMLLYVLGIPAGLLWLLHQNRHLIRDAEQRAASGQPAAPGVDPSSFGQSPTMLSFQHKYGFLYGGYRKPCFWWESLNLLRKVALSFFAVFFKFDIHSQGLFGLAICICALFAHVQAQPFVMSQVNFIETLSLWNSLATFLAGQFSFSSVATGQATLIAGLAAFILNLLFYLYVLMSAVRVLYMAHQEKAALLKFGPYSQDSEMMPLPPTAVHPGNNAAEAKSSLTP